MKLDGERCPACRGVRLIESSVNASDMPVGHVITVKECPVCDFAWQWPPQRDLQASIQHAKTRYTTDQDCSYYHPERREKVALEQLAFVESLARTPRRLLDVGAGDGAFVKVAASRGWSALGLDPAAPEEIVGNPAIRQITLDGLPAGELFDVVTLWDVIEHLDQPFEVLQEAVQRVRPGGWLVVETGNFQSLNRLKAGKSWWAYAADHRWYFSPPVVEQMFASLGLVNVKCGDRVLRPSWQGSRKAPPPWLGKHVRSALKKPHHVVDEIRSYLHHRTAAEKWPLWGGLSIFNMVGQRRS